MLISPGLVKDRRAKYETSGHHSKHKFVRIKSLIMLNRYLCQSKMYYIYIIFFFKLSILRLNILNVYNEVFQGNNEVRKDRLTRRCF